MEICRLHDMLTEAGIEHEFRDRTPPGWDGFLEKYGRLYPSEAAPHRDWGYQVVVRYPNGERMVSAIEGYGTLGYGPWVRLEDKTDLIEIMGLLTPEEEAVSVVRGYLTAEEVFRRIKEAIDG